MISTTSSQITDVTVRTRIARLWRLGLAGAWGSRNAQRAKWQCECRVRWTARAAGPRLQLNQASVFSPADLIIFIKSAHVFFSPRTSRGHGISTRLASHATVHGLSLVSSQQVSSRPRPNERRAPPPGSRRARCPTARHRPLPTSSASARAETPSDAAAKAAADAQAWYAEGGAWCGASSRGDHDGSETGVAAATAAASPWRPRPARRKRQKQLHHFGVLAGNGELERALAAGVGRVGLRLLLQ